MRLDEAKGSWALVTGASSGIGKEFCHQLAAAGFSLVMVARREALLEELSAQLSEKHNIQTLVIAIDLSQPAAAAQIKSRLDHERIKVRLLCNNAASMYMGKFETNQVEAYQAMICLNTTALVTLCWQLLPDLSSHPTSAIINVSSQAAYQPIPFMAVYAATKAFVQSFSQALYGEWQERGILVQTLVPGPTRTAFYLQAGADNGIFKEAKPAKEVVGIALAHLGKDTPIVTNVRDLYKQRLFAALAPSKIVIKTVAKKFRTPVGNGDT